MGEPRMTELYVCVHVAEFPAQALARLRPELTRGAMVVVEGEAPLEQVISANGAARRMGVRRGMTKAELESFGAMTVLRRSGSEERSAEIALLEAAGAFTPRVQVVKASAQAAWTMVLDMAGTERIFGPVEQSLAELRRALRGLKFKVRMAASANFHAAVCMAGAGARPVTVIPEGREAEWLAGLPLGCLGLTAQQAEAFELWGLKTLGELAALPEVDLIVRLGQEGKRLRLLARGQHKHLMVPREEVFALEEFLELDAPVELLESLLFVLGPMLGQLIARARNHALALAKVKVVLGLDGGGEHVRTIKPALPTADRELLLKLLHLDLEAHPPAAGVLTVRLTAEAGKRGKVQMGLFSPQLPEPARLDVTLARIAALVGEERVGRARLKDTHRPESFAMERFVVPAGAAKTQEARSCVALRRLRPPLALEVWREGERLSGFRMRGAVYRIEQAHGPWRRSGEWWSGEVWSSEEWDVEAVGAEGRVVGVVSYDRLGRVWRLEGLYD
jgi:protein ImuB